MKKKYIAFMLQNSHAAIPPLSEVRWCATLEPIYDPVVADNESCYPGGSVWSGNCQRLVSSKPKRRSWPSIGCAYRQCVRRRKWVWTPRGLSRNSSNACCYAGELESPEVCIFHLYSSFDRWINYSINQKSNELSMLPITLIDDLWEKLAGPKSEKKRQGLYFCGA